MRCRNRCYLFSVLVNRSMVGPLVKIKHLCTGAGVSSCYLQARAECGLKKSKSSTSYNLMEGHGTDRLCVSWRADFFDVTIGTSVLTTTHRIPYIHTNDNSSFLKHSPDQLPLLSRLSFALRDPWYVAFAGERPASTLMEAQLRGGVAQSHPYHQ